MCSPLCIVRDTWRGGVCDVWSYMAWWRTSDKRNPSVIVRARGSVRLIYIVIVYLQNWWATYQMACYMTAVGCHISHRIIIGCHISHGIIIMLLYSVCMTAIGCHISHRLIIGCHISHRIIIGCHISHRIIILLLYSVRHFLHYADLEGTLKDLSSLYMLSLSIFHGDDECVLASAHP